MPFRANGSSTDNNGPTQEAFNGYNMVASAGFDSEKILLKYGSFIDTKTGHGGVWQIAYDLQKATCSAGCLRRAVLLRLFRPL